MKKYAKLPMDQMMRLALLWSFATPVMAGQWWQKSDNSEYDTLKFGSSMDRDWLYNAGSISLKLEGCILGYNTADSEDAGCPENESEDGTIYWYQMANCLRPQAVFSLYASDSSSTSCSSSTFKESVSAVGRHGRLYMLTWRMGLFVCKRKLSHPKANPVSTCRALVRDNFWIRRVHLLPVKVRRIQSF